MTRMTLYVGHTEYRPPVKPVYDRVQPVPSVTGDTPKSQGDATDQHHNQARSPTPDDLYPRIDIKA